jgi:predicted  nucleic acid-binding Zn-ribbon protein
MRCIDISSDNFKHMNALCSSHEDGCVQISQLTATSDDGYALLAACATLCGNPGAAEQDPTGAFKFIKKYCEKYEPVLVENRNTDEVIRSNILKDIRWEAYYFLGECYRLGVGTAQDLEKAYTAYDFVSAYCEIHQIKLQGKALTFLSISANEYVHRQVMRIPKTLDKLTIFINNKKSSLSSMSIEPEPETTAPTESTEPAPEPPAAEVIPAENESVSADSAPPEPLPVQETRQETGKEKEVVVEVREVVKEVIKEVIVEVPSGSDDALVEKVKELSGALETERENVKLKEEQIQMLENSVSGLRKDLRKAESKASGSDAAESRIEELEEQEKDLRSFIEERDTKIAELEAEIKKLEDELHEFRESIRQEEEEVKRKKQAVDDTIKRQQLPFDDITKTFNTLIEKPVKELTWLCLKKPEEWEKQLEECRGKLIAALREKKFTFGNISCDSALGYINSEYRIEFNVSEPNEPINPLEAYYIYFQIAYDDTNFHSFYRDAIIVYPNPLLFVNAQPPVVLYKNVYDIPDVKFRWEKPFYLAVSAPFVLKRAGGYYVKLLMRGNEIRQRNFTEDDTHLKEEGDMYRILTADEYRIEINNENKKIRAKYEGNDEAAADMEKELEELEAGFRKIKADDSGFEIKPTDYQPTKPTKEE